MALLVEPDGKNRLLQDVLARLGNETCADCGNPGKRKTDRKKKTIGQSRETEMRLQVNVVWPVSEWSSHSALERSLCAGGGGLEDSGLSES